MEGLEIVTLLACSKLNLLINGIFSNHTWCLVGLMMDWVVVVVLGCNIYLDKAIDQGASEAEEEKMFRVSVVLNIHCLCALYMHDQFSN